MYVSIRPYPSKTKVWDVCEELETFIQDSKEVLWSEVRHIRDMAKALIQFYGCAHGVGRVFCLTWIDSSIS